MSFTVVERRAISPGADIWSFDILGDPTTNSGLKAAISSFAKQLDSDPAGVIWLKTGNGQTEWESFVDAAAGAGGGGVDPETPPFDNTGATDISAAMQAWFTLHAGVSPNNLPAGLYKVSTKFPGTSEARFDTWSKLKLKGDGPALTRIINGTLGTEDNGDAMISILGASYDSLKKLVIEDLTIGGISVNDVTRLIAIDGVDELTVDNVTLEKNAAEGMVSFSGNGQPRRTMITRVRSNDVGQLLGRGAWNINGDMQLLSQGIHSGGGCIIETNGSYTIVGDQLAENMHNGIQIGSTWSGGARPGIAEYNSRGAILHDGILREFNDRAILIPDYTGHDGIKGFLGNVKIHDFYFENVACAVWGGSDQWGLIEFCSNQIFGQFNNGGGFGPGTYAICPQGGYWLIHDNVIGLLEGQQQFSALLGYTYTDPKPDRQRIYRNTVRGYCWYGAFIPAFTVYEDTTLGYTKFEDDRAGSLASAIGGVDGQIIYEFRDSTSALTTANIRGTDFNWRNENHNFSFYHDKTIVPVLGDTAPPHMTFKPGDQLVADGAQSWVIKKCLTGGTGMPTPLSLTGTASSGASTMVVSSATGLFKYAYITVNGETHRIFGTVGTTVTIEGTFASSFTAQAVTYATPTWATI